MENKHRNVLMVILLIIIGVLLTFGLCYRYMVLENRDNSVVNEVQQPIVPEVKTVTVDKGVIPIFDVSKGKKVAETWEYTGEIIAGGIAKANISSDGKVTVVSDDKSIEVQGLSGKVVDVCSGTFGDGASAYMVFLMQDGTVELSTELYDSINAGVIESSGKVAGLKNIVRIECTKAQRTGDFNNKIRLTFIAIDVNGYFYDIMN